MILGSLMRGLWGATRTTGQLALPAAQAAVGGAALVGIGAASTAVRAGSALGYTAGQGAYNALKFMGRGRIPIEMAELGTGGPRILPQFNRAMQWTIAGGALAVGVGTGVANFGSERRWNMDRSIADGTLEMQRPDGLSATGSLALSLYKQRNQARLARMGYDSNGVNQSQVATMAANYGDDVLRIML